jgi:hypothetical protein
VRSEAADENILNSTRATDFIAPRSLAERLFRNAALALARTQPFARRFVNSGRLSLPTAYAGSSLSTADTEIWSAGPAPGAPIPDAPLGRLTVDHLNGTQAALHTQPRDACVQPRLEVGECQPRDRLTRGRVAQ